MAFVTATHSCTPNDRVNKMTRYCSTTHHKMNHNICVCQSRGRPCLTTRYCSRKHHKIRHQSLARALRTEYPRVRTEKKKKPIHAHPPISADTGSREDAQTPPPPKPPRCNMNVGLETSSAYNMHPSGGKSVDVKDKRICICSSIHETKGFHALNISIPRTQARPAHTICFSKHPFLQLKQTDSDPELTNSKNAVSKMKQATSTFRVNQAKQQNNMV